jgi:DNA-binding CsgD family transcriptional regulator
VQTGETEALLHRLLATVGADAGEPDGDDQVLLDVEVGDLRCLVIRQAGPSPRTLLSPREREIARMVALGYPNKTIASVLDISSWTVSSHLRRIFTKLQVSSRAAMATRLSMEFPSGARPPAKADNQVLRGDDDAALRLARR